MSEPLCIELYCGTFGWSQGWLELGGRSIGFDIEHLPHHGDVPEGASLVIQDVTTLHGSQFKNASLILASPPCTEYSYMAMPWKRAKQIAAALRGDTDNEFGVEVPFPEGYTGSRTIAELNRLFDACFRIQREACEAAGRYIPMVVENVRGAQPWVGRAKANFGSYYLWGDVGMVGKRVVAGVPKFGVSVQTMKAFKTSGMNWSNRELHGQDFTRIAGQQAQKRNPDGTDHGSGSWFKIADSKNRGAHSAVKNDGSGWRENGSLVSSQRMVPDGVSGTKQTGISGERNNGKGDRWFQDGAARHGSKPDSRKAASAQIARIPPPLAQYIAQVFAP